MYANSTPMTDLASVYMLSLEISGHIIKLHLNSVSTKFSHVKNKHVALDMGSKDEMCYEQYHLSNGLFFLESCNLITAAVCAYKLNNARYIYMRTNNIVALTVVDSSLVSSPNI